MFYIVGTPIGNLSDLSLRQAQTISQAAVILSEDTRKTGILLQKIDELFGFKANPERKLVSYHKENEFEKMPRIIDEAENGVDIVLISDSGMPLISDPGQLLVSELARRTIPYTCIPGPTAVTTALVMSGFNSHSFMFFGFLPKKISDKERGIKRAMQIADIEKGAVFVWYESPVRLQETMSVFQRLSPDAEVCICRELTKTFEEVARGKPHDFVGRSFKGEIVMVVRFD